MNKPTLQTVYLPVKVENNKEDFTSATFYITEPSDDGEKITHFLKPQEGYFFTSEQLNEYTANVIKQALETAAENVHLIEYGCKDNRVTNENAGQLYYVTSHYGEDNEVEISKQSITDTFKNTFEKFKI